MSKSDSTQRGLYRVRVLRRAEKELQRLPQRQRKKIVASIDVLVHQPRSSHTRKLAGGTNQYRLRVGEYRILYTIHDENRHVIIYRIAHRQSAYGR